MDMVSRLDAWKKCPEILRIIHAAPAFWGLQCGIWWYFPKDLSISYTAERKCHISDTMNESKTKEIRLRKFCLVIETYFTCSFLQAVFEREVFTFRLLSSSSLFFITWLPRNYSGQTQDYGIASRYID
jgi:hypothetical protein